MTQTRREYAASLGLAIAGARGKFSNDAKKAIAAAEAAGQKFSDTDPKPKPTPREAKTVTYKEAAANSDYRLPDEFNFPEAIYEAVTAEGERYGMREVCNNCRVSLVGHGCEFPTILGNIRVTVRLKKGVTT